jgi:hypothetical protein
MDYNLVEQNKVRIAEMRKYKQQILAEKEAKTKAQQEKNLKQNPRDGVLEGKMRTMTS